MQIFIKYIGYAISMSLWPTTNIIMYKVGLGFMVAQQVCIKFNCRPSLYGCINPRSRRLARLRRCRSYNLITAISFQNIYISHGCQPKKDISCMMIKPQRHTHPVATVQCTRTHKVNKILIITVLIITYNETTVYNIIYTA